MNMLQFWVLNLCHRDGHKPQSVYTNISTLMQYWGSYLNDHEDVQACEIKQEYISSDRISDSTETVLEVEILNHEKGVYERIYFLDAKDLVVWQDYHTSTYATGCIYDFQSMMLTTLHLNKD